MSSAVPILDRFARKNPSCICAIIGSRTAQKLCIITVTGTRNRISSQAPIRARYTRMTLESCGMLTSVFIPPSRPIPQKLRETIPALSHPRFHSRRHHAVEILHIGVHGDARDLRLAVETFERRRLGQFMVAGDAFENQGG